MNNAAGLEVNLKCIQNQVYCTICMKTE